jgi:alkanesulfonate monooxygenase SsuD/methylene tetrahydromethanopterin reductase-like flavin-dependent oxidoreductase (luciferase family)
MGESRDRFAEGTEILRRALTEPAFSFDGRFYRLPQTTVRPRPFSPDLVERMYAGVASASSLPIAARLGYKLMFVAAKPWEDAARDVEVFNDLRAVEGLPPMRPILVAPTVCSATEEQAWEQARRWIGGYLRTSVLHYQTDDPSKFEGVQGYESYVTSGSLTRQLGVDAAADHFARHALWGTPERCIERLQWLAEHVHVEQVVLLANPGGMSPDEAEQSLRLFAREVLPAVRGLEPAPFADAPRGEA